jgi:cell division protein FtsI/penicillin-binding protein 2
VLHPDLAAGDRLAAERTRGARGEVLGRDGEAVVADRPVVEVGVQPSRAADVDALAATLADVLDVDGAALAERIRSAGPEAFVPVITLRQEDYDAVAGQVRPLAGTVLRESTLPLAPTREFARALLGTVGPATAELVEESQGRLAAGDVTGLSGLQRRHDERLAGTAGVTVSLLPAEGDPAELFAVPATDGEDVATTLDPAVQQAADAALAGAAGAAGDEAALVAVDVPTGDVVAVANTPATGIDRASTGRYPPGSTFKTVSTLALLPTGLTPEEVVPCPETASVGGRSFRNFEGGALGEVPFREAFAQSCNTAFVTLSQRLEPGDLAAAASGVGIGGDWSVGVDAFAGDVPVEESAVEVAEASIGQGRVLASPLAMAVAAATIARGAWQPPNLVTEPAPGVPDGAAEVEQPAPDAERLATVRDLMREVAVSGTASALADVPPAADGSAVHAKTGTAEFGTGDPLPTHAWTIGFRGDLAFAVLVEGGESGGSVAVPVVEDFLRSLG